MKPVRTFYNCPFEAELEVSIETLGLLLDLMHRKQLVLPEETLRSVGHVYSTLFRSVATPELAALCHEFRNERRVVVRVTEERAARAGAVPPPDAAALASAAVNDEYARAHVTKIASILGVPLTPAAPAADQQPVGDKAPANEKVGTDPAK